MRRTKIFILSLMHFLCVFILKMASLKSLGNETAHREQLEYHYRLLRNFFKMLFFRGGE